MRKLFASLAVALAVGCSDRTAPTDLAVAPSFNHAPVTTTYPVAFPLFNPCTGADDVFSGTETLSVHRFEFGNPIRHHVNVQIQTEFETAAGFSGKQVLQVVDVGPDTELGGEEFSFLLSIHINLSNEAGQRLLLNVLFHITIRNGTVVRSEVFRASAECRGVPNGA